jgi:hypothetical protein
VLVVEDDLVLSELMTTLLDEADSRAALMPAQPSS